MNKPTISLCMIVKNEEATIGRCLNGVKDLVDEINIVDTGSKDNTITICKKYTDRITNFKWVNDFAEARNASIQMANCQWVLWLDADEEVDQEPNADLIDEFSQKKQEFLCLPVMNYVGNTLNEKDVYQIYQPRLFQNGLGFRFENKIHETLRIPDEEFQYDLLNLPVKHYGYLDSQKESKHQRNMKILKLEANREEHSPWIEYHTASEYYYLKDYEKAFQFVNYAILKFLEESILPPAIVYRLKYSILMESGNYNGAWPSIEKVIKLYPDYVDLHFIRASVLYELKNYKEAIQSLEECLKLGEDNHKFLILKGTGSFRAIELKQKCIKKLKENE